MDLSFHERDNTLNGPESSAARSGDQTKLFGCPRARPHWMLLNHTVIIITNCPDKGPMLERSAFQIFQSNSTHLIKPNFHVLVSH